MRLYLCLALALAALVSIIIRRCYPLTRAKALETRRLLEARRAAL